MRPAVPAACTTAVTSRTATDATRTAAVISRIAIPRHPHDDPRLPQGNPHPSSAAAAIHATYTTALGSRTAINAICTAASTSRTAVSVRAVGVRGTVPGAGPACAAGSNLTVGRSGGTACAATPASHPQLLVA